METEVTIIEILDQGKKMEELAHSSDVNCSPTGTILNYKDKIKGQ